MAGQAAALHAARSRPSGRSTPPRLASPAFSWTARTRAPAAGRRPNPAALRRPATWPESSHCPACGLAMTPRPGGAGVQEECEGPGRGGAFPSFTSLPAHLRPAPWTGDPRSPCPGWTPTRGAGADTQTSLTLQVKSAGLRVLPAGSPGGRGEGEGGGRAPCRAGRAWLPRRARSRRARALPRRPRRPMWPWG